MIVSISNRSVVRASAIVTIACALLAPTTAAREAQAQSNPGSAVSTEAAPYCPDLKHITNLAMTRERFASIISKPREGNFQDTSRPLTGWDDCVFYGTRTYTCDSRGFKSEEEAAVAQRAITREILSCLETWDEAQEQTSTANFIVLHPRLGPASITLNLDQTNDGQHIVRLILFLRLQ
jgi:hypothetical protein